MKFRILVLALATALIGASAAFAHDGNPGKGKRPDTGPNCKTGKVLLRGTLANDPVAGDSSFQLTATKGNHKGRAYVSSTQPVTINVDGSTKVMRKAKGESKTSTLESLAMGDRALVLSTACKGDLRGGATPQLMARFVLARPASA